MESQSFVYICSLLSMCILMPALLFLRKQICSSYQRSSRSVCVFDIIWFVTHSIGISVVSIGYILDLPVNQTTWIGWGILVSFPVITYMLLCTLPSHMLVPFTLWLSVTRLHIGDKS